MKKIYFSPEPYGCVNIETWTPKIGGCPFWFAFWGTLEKSHVHIPLFPHKIGKSMKMESPVSPISLCRRACPTLRNAEATNPKQAEVEKEAQRSGRPAREAASQRPRE